MKNLSHSQFHKILSARNGAAIVGIEALTDARALKTGNPHGTIFKHVRAVGFVGANYEKAVQREGERQGADASDFSAQPLKWGTWDIPGKVIAHKGEFYLRTQSTPGQRKRQPPRLLAYRDTAGKFLAKDAVRPFLPKKSSAATQKAAGLGEEIMVRTYAFSSIRKVRVNGETFNLVRG